MNKEEIIAKLDSYKWPKETSTTMLVGFNVSQAITVHRVKIGNTISEPIITLLMPTLEPSLTFEDLDKKFVNYSIMEFMSYEEFISEYDDLDDAQKKLAIKLSQDKNEQE